MLKKILSVMMSAVLLLSVGACGSADTPAEPADHGTSSDASAPESEEPKEPITLTLWSQWPSDSDGMKKPLDNVIAAWNEANPNVQIEVDTINTESYKQKIKIASSSNELPDIFFSWGAGFAKPFVEAGRVLELTPYIDDTIKNSILPGTLENYTYDGKVYGLPSYMWLGVLYCNQKLFDDNGVKVPDTYDELLTAVEKFKSVGLTPIECGEKELWTGIQWQNAFALRTAGMEECVKALSKETSFDTPEFAQSGQLLADLVSAGAFSDAVMGREEAEAEANFAQEKAAMILMGDWAATTFMAEDSLARDHITVKNVPSVSGGKDPDVFLGGAIDTFMVSAQTEHPEESVAALKYICENLCRESYLAGASLPAWKLDVDMSEIDPLTRQITELSQTASGFMLAWDTFLEGEDADIHLSAVANLFGGKSNGEDFAKAMDKISD